ncbi:MAG: hypothetical protein QG597_2659 [Actinomycetota bacterium]|nr:hypothetical protein [Actinomycetota bacterium]
MPHRSATDTPLDGCFYEAVIETETYAEDAYSGTFVSTHHTVSPWSEEHQHAGPASALLVRAVERLTIPTEDALTNQVSVDILNPIPRGAIAVTAQVVRAGRFATLVEAELTHAGFDEPIMRLSAWRTRRRSVDLPGHRGDYRPAPAPGVETVTPTKWGDGYAKAIQWQVSAGSLDGHEPSTVWATPRAALVGEEPAAGVPLVMLIADAASGLSALADPADYVFVNTDLNVHVVREPDGPAVWIAAESFLDPDGIGLATSTIGDRQGSLAVGSQALFLARRDEVGF